MGKSKEAAVEMLDEKGRKPLKLNYGITFKVGFAFAIVQIFWTAYDFVVPLLLENAYGLPSWARGLIMGLDNLLALFMLPLFGKLSDNSHGKLAKKFGRRTPFILIGTICAALLMVFVPVATLGQQRTATDYVNTQIEARLDEDAFMEPLLTEWYENSEKKVQGSANYCDIDYLNANNMTKEDFVAIRKYEGISSKKAVLNLLGAVTYSYNGEAIEDLNAESPIAGKTYQDLIDSNDNYAKYVESGMSAYKSDQIFNKFTSAKDGIKSIAIYMVILLLVLIAMATFRSPAVALMPDVTPKPLRSQANAIINLCGGIGGAIAFLIYTIALFNPTINTYVIIFASVAAGMLLLLAGFLALVKEKKLVERCQEICKEYEIDDFAEEENKETQETEEELTENVVEDAEAKEQVSEETVQFAKDVVENAKKKHANPKVWWNGKTKDEKSKLVSFWLILASIFMWFMGYNAVSSNLSVYTTKALNLSAGIASIISGVSMGISAIAFIPVGYMAAKIGRRKSIMIGYALAVVSFILICFAIMQGQGVSLKTVLFTLFYLISGFGLIIANVNTFPMVTELSTAENVGAYTGYYYVATMSAQAITPFVAGWVMDLVAYKYLFLYSAICIVIAILLMLFVKHGDSIQLVKGRKLTKEEKKQIRLDSIDAD